MARLALNKSGLQKERQNLQLYQRLLPSLDLKRRQLTLEQSRAEDQLARDLAEVERLRALTAEQLPMIANRAIELSGLVQVESVRVGEENLVGVKLPVLEELTCTVRDYSMLAKPPWVDVLVGRLKQMAELQARVRVARERLRRLEGAVRRLTQRVNLFDKILIPTAKKNIQYIQIFLSDAERSAVIRSKLTKAIHERQRRALASAGEQS